MKWITTTIVVAVALATNSCVKGQDVNNFILDLEDATGVRGQQEQLIKSSRSKSAGNEEVLIDSTPPLLPKKVLVKKPESVGVLSNDKESNTPVDPQDQTVEEEVLSVSRPQDVEKRQAQAQGRRLDAAALQTFKDRCDATNIPGLSGSDAFVNCNDGQEVDFDDNPTGQTCADACDGLCCTGNNACGFINSDGTIADGTGFTGKGKQRVIQLLMYVNHFVRITY